MAKSSDTYDFDLYGGYQSTRSYKEANPNVRRQLNRYKKENDISDEHMFLIMFEKDLDAVPAQERTKGDTATNIMLIVGFLLLWTTLQQAWNAPGGANVPLIFLSVGSFLLVVFIYYSGMLNPYKRARRELNKRMSKMPEVVDFDTWNRQNPGASPKKKKGKKRR